MLPAFSQVRARHDLHGVFRASRESEEHLRHILEMQPAIVFVLDAETRITAMNRAGLAEVHGFSPR
jgi:PAS domain-containing protein